MGRASLHSFAWTDGSPLASRPPCPCLQIDPSVSVMVDVQNTLVNNVFAFYANDHVKSWAFPRLATDTVCTSRCQLGKPHSQRLTARDRLWCRLVAFVCLSPTPDPMHLH